MADTPITPAEKHGLPAIDTLHADALHSTPIDFDWSEAPYDYDGFGGPGTWTYWEMEECYGCGNLTDTNGYCETEDCESFGDHHEGCEGPMMSYYYPLERDVDPEEAARQLYKHGSATCLVRIDGHAYGLALTGGGMDLSWEICQSFIALGLLPPLHFARLPKMAGRPHGERDRHIVRACLKSFEIAARRAAGGSEHLQQMLTRGPL